MLGNLFGRIRGAASHGIVGGATATAKTAVRNMSGSGGRKRAENVRKINPRMSPQEASSIARSLYDLLNLHGPLSISHAWLHAQDAGVTGLSSKTHMKLMLKWMRGRKMVKLLCNHVGSSKKFLLSTLPEDPKVEAVADRDRDRDRDRTNNSALESKMQTKKKPSLKLKATRKKQTR